ncbi:MAG: hypothetical protein KAI66_09635 [Lentisphaeria bacterium]|nr:hypothetical protein [Lentisphaeria bacterium]
MTVCDGLWRGDFSRFWRVFATVCVWTLLLSPGAQAGDDATDRAAGFLVAARGANGLWGTECVPGRMLRLIRVLQAAKNTESTEAAMRARAVLVLSMDEDEPVLSKRVLLHMALESDDLSWLGTTQNVDGGWGAAEGRTSNPLDTVLAMETLLENGDANTQKALEASAKYFADTQRDNGCWRLTEEMDPLVLPLTARIVRCLVLAWRRGVIDTPQESAVSLAAAHLRAARQVDGTFLPAPGARSGISPSATAEAYRALVLMDPPGIYADTRNVLLAVQHADGSWREPGGLDSGVYTTATVLLALQAVALPELPPLPDLAVTTSSISFQPSRPMPGDTVQVRAAVFNLGNAASSAFSVRFHAGDPHAGTPSFATVACGGLSPLGVSIVESSYTVGESLTSRPRIAVHVDPANEIRETTLGNNLALRELSVSGLPSGDLAGLPNLIIPAADITYDGRAAETTIFLTQGPTVRLCVPVYNAGGTEAGGARLTVTCDGTPVGTVNGQAIAAGGYVTHTFPWCPAAGTHILTFEIDTDAEVPESDESDNQATQQVEVVGAASAVHARKLEGALLTDLPAGPFEDVCLLVTSAYVDPQISFVVTAPDGSAAPGPVPLQAPGRYVWHARNRTPGEYAAEVTLSDRDSGTLLDAVACTFEVAAGVSLDTLRVRPSLTVVQAGVETSVAISAELQNRSNVDAQWSIHWSLHDSDGTEIRTSASQTVALASACTSQRVVLPTLAAGGLAGGNYELRVLAEEDGGTLVVEDRVGLDVLPQMDLVVETRLEPAITGPASERVVHTILRLTVPDQTVPTTAPVAVRSIETAPASAIVDATGSEATVTASGFVNSLGKSVAEGVRVAVCVPYGTLSADGGEPSPNATPRILLVPIADDQITIRYSPEGTALTDAACTHSTVVVAIRQYFAGQDTWLGKVIGSTQILLVKPE